MSVVPEEWSEPGSRGGLAYELLWISLAAAVAAALLYWEPFSIDAAVTPTRVVGSMALGAVLAVGIWYASYANDRARAFWRDWRRRFVAIFVVVMALQAGLALAPTWTLLAMFATSVALVPLRLHTYVRARRRSSSA